MPRDYDWSEGITDNQSIREALMFASRWQRGEWSVSTLPRDLRVGVRVGRASPTELGACVEREDGRRGIALNEQIVGTRGFIPILAHECGHLFQPCVVGLCRSGVQMSRREREAWWIASILAVPLEAVQSVKLFGDGAGVIARQLEVPRPLVILRAGVAHCMGEIKTRESRHARLLLDLGTMSMMLWISRFSEQLAERGNP